MKKMIIGILSAIILAISFAIPIDAATITDICNKNPDAAICKEACIKNPAISYCKIDNPGNSINNTIKTGLNFFFGLIGVLAVALIIWSGIRMTIFQNNDTKTWAKARNILLYSVIGLVVSALALVIVNLTMNVVDQIDPL